MINIAELITDPDFCQPSGVTIIRTETQIIDHVVKGNPQVIVVPGIITISNENSDSLLSEADRNSESIHVFTHERLKTVGYDKIDGKEYAADKVLYNGSEYIVRYCLDDAQYGFCRSTAIKIEQDVM